jgi:hypothetical protein
LWTKPWRSPKFDDPFDNIGFRTAVEVGWMIWMED